MQKTLWVLMFLIAVLVVAPSCNHNKIACPTYADSFPEANKKKKKSKKPEDPNALPKGGKATLSITPPGMH